MVENQAQPVRQSHARTWWVAGAIVAGLLVAAAGIWFVTANHGPATPVLPRVLLGLSEYTGPGAQAHANGLEKQARANSDGLLAAPVAAFYRGTAGGFNVVAGVPCTEDSCMAGTGQQLVQALSANGVSARAFPPGPGGDYLVCAVRTVQGTAVISCVWGSPVTAGQVYFLHGFATSVADAAAKTRKIRAALER
jgi:hypothetical protein